MVVNLDNVRVLGECAFLLRMKHDVGLLGAGYDKRNALRHGCYIYICTCVDKRGTKDKRWEV